MKFKKIVIIILIFVLLGISVFSVCKILSAMQKYQKSEESYSAIVSQYIEFEATEKETVPISVNFDELKNSYDDVIGWIYSENTPINYPVVQGQDNDYYLRRLPNGKWDIAGSIFADFRNSPDFNDLNTVIYGHNMKNDSMFGKLEKYKTQEYYDAHPVMYLFTPDKSYKILLISAYTTSAGSNDTYCIPNDKNEQKEIIENALAKSTFTTDVEINEQDRLITLSTCADDYDDARYVVVGVLREVEN